MAESSVASNCNTSLSGATRGAVEGVLTSFHFKTGDWLEEGARAGVFTIADKWSTSIATTGMMRDMFHMIPDS